MKLKFPKKNPLLILQPSLLWDKSRCVCGVCCAVAAAFSSADTSIKAEGTQWIPSKCDLDQPSFLPPLKSPPYFALSKVAPEGLKFDDY